MRSEQCNGLAVSPGIAAGPAFCYYPENRERPAGTVQPGRAQEELAQLAQALQTARTELEQGISRFSAQGAEKADIFCAHLEILNDPCMAEGIQQRISAGTHNCSQAIWDAYQEVLDALQETGDPVFQGRAADIHDVRDRLLRCREGRAETALSQLEEGTILLARELSPSDMANLPRDRVLAIATQYGGATSHMAILARASGIPAVLGVDRLMEQAESGQTVIVNALEGFVITEPDKDALKDCQTQRDAWLRAKEEDEAYLHRRAVTTDGVEIFTNLNLGSIADTQSEAAAWADGVGLLRTEFLYMESETLPDEETQYQAYVQVLQAFGDRPVILRTLDIGGDKRLPYLDLPKEDNPFLGLRALRFCFTQESLFRTQLRAAYRASVHGNLWLMFPMVTSMDDFRRAKALCVQVKQELAQSSVPFRNDVRLGIMIEVPSIALVADQAAKETDFASIGTNDLCQYVCAADRMNPSVSAYYQGMNPGLLRLISYTAKAYADAGKPVGVCGELASDPKTAVALIGLGIRSLSMSVSALGPVRRALSQTSLQAMQAQAEQLLSPVKIFSP